jgi:hypothetical protein
VQRQIIDRRLNASGSRDTARGLRVRTHTVRRARRRQEAILESVNTGLLRTVNPDASTVDMQPAGEAW